MILTNDLPANAKIAIKKDDIIVSTVRPYRGAVAICDFDVPVVSSGAFLVLSENGHMLKECLLVLLRTRIYCEYMMKYNVDSSYPVVKDYDILKKFLKYHLIFNLK
jgi:type I restriction enzyme S subunit